MDNNEKIEERKNENRPFLAAFEVLKKEKKTKQGKLAKELGTNSSLISAYKAGQKKVSADMLERIMKAFNGRLSYKFLIGQSPDMCVDDEQAIKKTTFEHVDFSSLINATLAAKDETITSLIRELETKNALIQDLRKRMEEKEAYMLILKEKIAELKQKNAEYQLAEYPFAVGAADPKEKRTRKTSSK